MPALPRRRALQLAGGVLVSALAGCNGSDSASRAVPPSHQDGLDDITVLKIRSREPTPIVAAVRDEDESTTRTEVPPPRRGDVMLHVTGTSETNERRPRFRTDAPGVDRVRSFFDDTDFETESIYLMQSTIPECYDRQLTSVTREPDSVDAHFCRTLRPADVDCETDSHDLSLFAIRLPFPGDDFSGFGGGESSSCDARTVIEPDVEQTVGADTEGTDQ